MIKRIFLITLALSLGWYVGALSANPTEHHQGEYHETSESHTATASMSEHGDHGEEASASHHSFEHEAAHSAKAIVTGAVAGAPWLCGMLLGAAGLFGAAVLIGPVAMKIQGPEPAEEEDHAH